MIILDIVIVLLFITAIMRGAERGLVRQACSTIGLLIGFLVGAFAQGKLIHLGNTPASKAMLSLILIFVCILIFTVIGEYVGSRFKHKLVRLELHKINKADKGAGAVVGGITLLIIVWLAAAVFAGIPTGSLQRQIDNSVIIAQLDQTLPNAPRVFSSLGHLIDPNGFPEVFTGLEPHIDTTTPLPSIGELDAAVSIARKATVKIQGEGCGGISNGSGFVADDNLVVTNAHVVAGVANPFVLDANGRHSVIVRWFDPNLDLAILEVSQLAGKPLAILDNPVGSNTPAAVLGYPGGGDFSARGAVVLEAFKAQGRNIYNQEGSLRQIYSLKSEIVPGNSGGPLVDVDGEVIGVVFARSSNNSQVGYALTMEPVIAGLNKAKDQQRVVGTGSCTN